MAIHRRTTIIQQGDINLESSIKRERQYMKYYVCKKIRLMVFLQKKGFNFIKIQEDRNDHDRVVWIFIETPELRDAIEEYYSRKEFLNRNKNRNT